MKFKKRLLSGILSASLLLGGMAAADEIDPGMQEPVSHSYVLKKPASKPKINFIIEKTDNIDNNSEEVTNYSISENAFYNHSSRIFRNSNIPELTAEEITKMENLISNISSGDIHSYQGFLDSYTNLSENQRIVLLSAIGNLLYQHNYDSELTGSVFSQDEFFDIMQPSLNDEENGIGVCRHISSHLEQLANDSGIRASEVSGIGRGGGGHAFVVMKTKEGSAVVDSYRILTAETKNIEKILEAYQKDNGTTAFDHLFFEDTVFKYRLITKEAKDFLDFVGYDESSKTLKDYFVSKDKVSSPDLKVVLNQDTSSNSLELNCLGFFVKEGKIFGEKSSPLEEMHLMQTGFRRDFSVLGINIYPDLSFIYGNIIQDKEFYYKRLIGANGNLVIKTNNEKGFNIGLRIGGNGFTKPNSGSYLYVFFDTTVEGALSCKIPLGKQITINPYLISKANLFPKDVGVYAYLPMLSELGGGIPFNAELKETKISLEPNYSWGMWENRFGVNAEIKNKNFGLKAEGYITKSNYDFCPDKFGLNIETEFSLKNSQVKRNDLTLKLLYGLEGTNYDGEIDKENKLGVSCNIKY